MAMLAAYASTDAWFAHTVLPWSGRMRGCAPISHGPRGERRGAPAGGAEPRRVSKQLLREATAAITALPLSARPSSSTILPTGSPDPAPCLPAQSSSTMGWWRLGSSWPLASGTARLDSHGQSMATGGPLRAHRSLSARLVGRCNALLGSRRACGESYECPPSRNERRSNESSVRCRCPASEVLLEERSDT